MEMAKTGQSFQVADDNGAREGAVGNGMACQPLGCGISVAGEPGERIISRLSMAKRKSWFQTLGLSGAEERLPPVVVEGIERRKPARQLSLGAVGGMPSVGSESIMETPG